ncbi:MAG TPA: UDP-4-amino-4,6-dideoxy-N-acetyl-beta-L-altrosamine transaminase [Bacteroidetes bacterium]|nr:UDP-4-amino-4,6-dideoxy-N-acetyl-beta-L-altrosamine transaminase [Bacteroidota bacterium]
MTKKYSIPYGKQHITKRDIDSVTKVLQSDFLTQGPEIAQFEQAFANYVGSTYAVAVANGTAALHLCALALDVNETSKVITTPITFAATGNCIRYCGGTLDFADIDSETYLLDLDAVRSKLESAPKGTYSGIIPVDFAGRAVNLEAFRKLADEYGLWIIEDACHAPGGYFTDSQGVKQFCGNGKYADLAIFSFHPVKHIAAGEGGMITTNDKTLYERLLKLRTHGITKNESDFELDLDFANGSPNSSSTSTYPGWYMEMQELGYNYRLTDFQAALGLSQLQDAPHRLDRRREIAQKYNDAFSDSANILGQSGYIDGHAYHLYILETPKRLELYNFLRTNGIYAQVHYIPLHLMPYYRNFGWKSGDLPNAESYYKGCLSLPMFPTLTDEEQNFVITKIKDFLE